MIATEKGLQVLTDKKKIALFAYNFPHRKTQDFIFKMHVEGHTPDLIIAADPIKLSIPPASVRTKVRHCGTMHPRNIAETLGIPYVVLPHNNKKVVTAVEEHGIDLAVIAGARILKKHIIDAFGLGIINYHPGLIPQTRGLDAMMWSVHNDIPQAITAHLIDPRIDAGRIMFVEELPIWADDTPFDVQERLYEMQIDMIPRSIEMAIAGEGYDIGENADHNTKMDPETEAETLRRFPAYVTKRATR